MKKLEEQAMKTLKIWSAFTKQGNSIGEGDSNFKAYYDSKKKEILIPKNVCDVYKNDRAIKELVVEEELRSKGMVPFAYVPQKASIDINKLVKRRGIEFLLRSQGKLSPMRTDNFFAEHEYIAYGKDAVSIPIVKGMEVNGIDLNCLKEISSCTDSKVKYYSVKGDGEKAHNSSSFVGKFLYT